jgi:hypothetical protein
MEAVGPEVYGEAEQRERWVDADLRRIAGDAEEEGGRGFEWKPHAVGRNRRDQCFVHKARGDPVWWIKVVGQVFDDEAAEGKDEVAKKTNTKEDDDEVEKEGEENEGEDQPHPLLRNVDNLLDEGLHVRQHEWHQLYVVPSPFLCACVVHSTSAAVCVCVCAVVRVRWRVCVLAIGFTHKSRVCVGDGQDGRIFERVDDKAELCYFQYASPIFFVSGRDTCYIKIRRDLDDGGFILSYRSIRHDVPSPCVSVIVCVLFLAVVCCLGG